MSTRFNDIMPFIFKWEGGYTNDPDDRGGATNLGIIQREYDPYRRSKGKPTQSVKLITMAEALDIYDTKYWEVSPAKLCPKPLDMIVMDTAVNMGISAATRMLQSALNVTADGAFGPASKQAIADHCYNDEATMHIVSKYVGLREARYRSIATGKGQSKFLKGWLNRLRDLSKSVGLAVSFEFVGDEPEFTAKAYSAYGQNVFEPVNLEGEDTDGESGEEDINSSLITTASSDALTKIKSVENPGGLFLNSLGIAKRRKGEGSVQETSLGVAEVQPVAVGLSVDYDNLEIDEITWKDTEDETETDGIVSASSAFEVKGFVVHLTASKWGDAAAVREWHTQERGWSDIGYHAVILNGYRTSKLNYEIAVDGKIEPGRSESIMGAHCLANGMNRCTLGVSLIGNPAFTVKQSKLGTLGATPKVAYATERQEDALVHWLVVNCKQYGVDPLGTFTHPVSGKQTPTISQHSQWDANKPSCASLDIPKLRAKVAAVLQAMK